MTPDMWIQGLFFAIAGIAIIVVGVLWRENKKEVIELREKIAESNREISKIVYDLNEIAPAKAFTLFGDPIHRPNLSKSIDLLYDYLNVETQVTPEKTELVKRKKQKAR